MSRTMPTDRWGGWTASSAFASMLLFACAPTPDSANAPATDNGTAPVHAGVVHVEAGKFVVDDAPHRVVGANFWAGMNLGSAGAGGDRARLRRELDRLAALGVNNLRIMAASEGPNGAPYRVAPALMPRPGEYDLAVFEGLDVLLAECASRGLRVVMVLNNFWEWSGGMAQYVAWAEGTPIPYPAKHVWTDFTAYATRFYACASCQTWYRDHVRTVVSRINTINGRAYREDPTIFAWQLANEPRYYPAEWIDETAAFIRSLGVAQMISTGSEGRIGGPFVDTHDGPNIDYATAHLWPQNWQWYDPQRIDTFASGLATSLAYVDEHTQASRELGKPLIIEEYGLARDTDAGVDPFDPRAPVRLRDRFYDAVLEAVEQSVAAGDALQGQAFWAWGGEARPPGPWLGDPPHEKPGWYSVYDKDSSTLARLREHATVVESTPTR